MPISGQPGIGRGGPARIRVGQVVTVEQVTAPSFIGGILGDTGETRTTTTPIFAALGAAKGNVALPLTGLKGSSADQPFGKAPLAPGPQRATAKPSGPIQVAPPTVPGAPPPLMPRVGRTFILPAGVLSAPPPASRPVNQGFPLRFFPKVAEKPPSVGVLRQRLAIAEARATALLKEVQAVRESLPLGGFTPFGAHPVDAEAGRAASFAIQAEARLEAAEWLAQQTTARHQASEAVERLRQISIRNQKAQVNAAAQNEIRTRIQGIRQLAQIIRITVLRAAPITALPQPTLEGMRRDFPFIHAPPSLSAETILVLGALAMGALQRSSPPSNLAPSQRGIRPGGMIVLAAPPQAPAPPQQNIGDAVPPGKLGGSTSQDTVVAPEITAGPGKLGGGPTTTTRVRDAHFPDITERR